MLRSALLLAFSFVGAAAAMPAAAESPARFPADLPAGFAVGDRRPIATLHATGAQIYECKAAADGTQAWTFREPIAALMDNGKTVGRHFAGPSWDLDDGSGVTGKVVSSAPSAGPNDVAQLALQVVAHHGTGLLAEAGSVLRLRTAGGALKGACDRAGELRSIPYTADYVFLR